MRGPWLFAILSILTWVASGCGTEGESSTESAYDEPVEPGQIVAQNRSDTPRTDPTVYAQYSPTARTIVVIDDGFDLNHSVFANKVVAAYSIDCSAAEGVYIDFENQSFESAKAAVLQVYQGNLKGCSLSNGITLDKSPEFATIEPYRTTWNNFFLQKLEAPDLSFREFDTVANVVSGRGGYNYHGTSTAGIIAYQNPDINLVLIQLDLGTSYAFDSFGLANGCLTQQYVDNYYKVLTDDEVVAAYASHPKSSLDLALEAVFTQYQVSIGNMSFGSAPKSVLEQLYWQSGCGILDLSGLYKVENIHAKARQAYYESHTELAPYDFLTIQSAGNDGVPINSAEESFQCEDQAANHLVAGSISYARNLSSFSEYGDCVSIFAIGEEVIASVPSDFYMPFSGTSASAPIAVRFAAAAFDDQLTPKELMEQMLSIRDSQKYLPESHYPEELAWASPLTITGHGLYERRPGDVLKDHRFRLLPHRIPMDLKRTIFRR